MYYVGNGCVVNQSGLLEEIPKNESRGITNWSEYLLISDQTHLGIKVKSLIFFFISNN